MPKQSTPWTGRLDSFKTALTTKNTEWREWGFCRITELADRFAIRLALAVVFHRQLVNKTRSSAGAPASRTRQPCRR